MTFWLVTTDATDGGVEGAKVEDTVDFETNIL